MDNFKWIQLGVWIALVGGMLFYMTSCVTGQIREDKISNKAVEKLCSSKAAIKVMERDKQLFREYVCLCQQVSGKVGAQNACESIINSNNSLAIIAACPTTDTVCQEHVDKVFTRRK